MATFYTLLEGPVNSLALNRDHSQVAIGGRNVFKVYAIGEDHFREVVNLRVAKHLNLSFSCNDISWSTIDDHYLATAAANGHVCVWNITRLGKSMQEQNYQEHKRTVNRVNFHASEPYRLISGSQDGTMRYFDIRVKDKAVAVFNSNTESIRDVQFSPYAQNVFCGASENGSVQLWDIRRTDRYLIEFSAHGGPVFSCDWHPEKSHWLATGSRDKCIKVWSLGPVLNGSSGLSKSVTMDHVVHSIASVGQIRWRPQREFHLASVALVVDCSVNIWDVRRPYVPFACFTEHKDVTSGVAWKNDPHTFLSAGRDSMLYHHGFNKAIRPSLNAISSAVTFSNRGEVICTTRVVPKEPAPSTLSGFMNSSMVQSVISMATLSGGSGSLGSGIGSSKGLLTGGAQRKYSNTLQHITQASMDVFHLNSSRMFLYSARTKSNDQVPQETFVGLAKDYKLDGGTLSEICDHNTEVASHYSCTHLANFWQVVKILYGDEFLCNDDVSESEKAVEYDTMTNKDDVMSATNESAISNRVPKARPQLDNIQLSVLPTEDEVEKRMIGMRFENALLSARDEIDDVPPSPNDSISSHNMIAPLTPGMSSVYTFPPEVNFRTGLSAYYGADIGDFTFGDNELDGQLESLLLHNDHLIDYNERSTSFRPYVKSGDCFNSGLHSCLYGNNEQWVLPNEAFHQRHDIRDCLPANLSHPYHESPMLKPMDFDACDDEPSPTELPKFDLPPFTPADFDLPRLQIPQPLPIYRPPVDNIESIGVDDSSTGLLTTAKYSPRLPMFAAGAYMAAALRQHALSGDVQTAASVLLVLGNRRKYITDLDEMYDEHWILFYLELLAKVRLWNVATKIIKHCTWLPSICGLSYQSTRFHTRCGDCGLTFKQNGWKCERCNSTDSALCSVCRQVVRGIYVWCQGCAHGGHLDHIRDWMLKNKVCATGCGHICRFPI